MLYWLATAAKQLREQHGRKQVHIAASRSTDQSSIYRFENADTWTRDPDLLIAAYADDLDIEDPREIWELALKMWREQGQAPSLESLSREPETLADALEGDDADAGEQPPATPVRGRRAKARRPAAG